MIRIFKLLFKKPCKHLFRACDMSHRDKNGMVHWNCCKCGKEFIEPCGLDVLRNGKCDGKWAEARKIKCHSDYKAADLEDSQCSK